jgi:hypothetical protein
VRRRILFRAPLLLIAALVLAGCHRGDAALRAEGARLRRQNDGLRALLARVDGRRFIGDDQLVVGVRQELVRDLLQAQLPLERVVLDRFRFLLDRADVRFEASQSLVSLSGHAETVADPGVYADVTCTGGLEAIEIDPRTGVLVARVTLDHVDLERVGAGVMEDGFARSLVEGLGGRGLGALGEVVPPLEIPVRLERAIESRGLADGPVRVAAARLPLHTTAKAVAPVAGRLWIVLEVTAGGRETAPATSEGR